LILSEVVTSAAIDWAIGLCRKNRFSCSNSIKKKKKTIFAESYRYSSYIFQIFSKINVRFCREMKEEKKRKGLWNESLVILKQRTCFPDTQDFFSAVWIDDLPFFIRLIVFLERFFEQDLSNEILTFLSPIFIDLDNCFFIFISM